MESFAKKLAINHKTSGYASKKTFPIKKVVGDFEAITKAYKLLSESVEKDVPISLAGEWLLDNYYIIEEQVSSVLNSLNLNNYRKLPAIDGVARIYVVIKEFVKFSDGDITKEKILLFINSYQSQKVFLQCELYEVQLMLKIALIEHIRNVADKIIVNQLQKFKVESLIERIIKKDDFSEQKFYKYKNIKLDNEAASYVEHLIFKLKKMGSISNPYIEILEEEINKSGASSDEIIKAMHYDMAVRRVSISNSIISLKNISRLNFKSVFENVNVVEKILSKDYAYVKLDETTKEIYRNKIKEIAEKTHVSEIYVANELNELIDNSKIDMSEFLIGERRDDLLNKIGYSRNLERNVKKLVSKYKLLLYLAFIYVPTFLISYKISNIFWPIIFIPFSEVFVTIVNRVVLKGISPKILPRFEKIDGNVNTFVIVPTLLKSKERVEELMQSIEVYYLRNKIPGLYFCLLGDASEEKEEYAKHDEEVKNAGIEAAKRLNKKYNTNIFNFAYRKRIFNKKQGTYLGYERKRGMINEFNDFLLYKKQGTFIINTIQNIPKIKYVITLDADTEMPFDAARKLIGTMEHPFNSPKIEKGIVKKGYGLVQPKIGLSIEASSASIFSKLFAGAGGIDIYSTAESNVYQDLFEEAIFTGKGIYNLEVFDEVLRDEIPENKVLSHDLLEGSYLRVGLASDIELIDGFPAKVNSYMLRSHRWIRGDWQILSWLLNKKINLLSKYKIFDNLRRSLIEPFTLALFFLGFFYLPIILIFFPLVIGIRRRFFDSVNELKDTIIRSSINFILLPYKAVMSLKAIGVTLYRTIISKKNLLEWVTAADAEKMLGNDIKTYAREMIISPIIGLALVLTTLIYNELTLMQVATLFLIWYSAPMVAYRISQINEKKNRKITSKEKEELTEIAKRTWLFFDTYMNEENNYLMPDNFDDSRKMKITNHTSSTNIGLSIVAVISAYNIGFIKKEDAINRIKNIINTIEKLEKWNGHLYNWYNIKTLKPIKPEFVSSVDSGNFVGYLYTLKGMLEENNFEKELQKKIQSLIDNTDFSKLYDYDKNLFSIGYDISSNKLVDSYYDLLASEARLASFVAIAKEDIPYKHWFCLGRACTKYDRKYGLVSWSGTMFEYFMPNVIMKNYNNSLMQRTCEFVTYSQQKYAKKLNIPWGISESAFALKDLKYNYQYKAFGVPWLGLKRGLDEDIVVSPYSSIMAIEDATEDVLKNITKLKEMEAYDKYGFFESIDFTPSRVQNKKIEIVKTYMAHHQALILLSINNFLNQNILRKYFEKNSEIRKVEILLQEKLPRITLYTNEKKENVKKLKYQDFEEETEELINKSLENVNILTNDEHTLLISGNGDGYSKIGDIYITRFNNIQKQSNVIYVKNLNTNEFWSNTKHPTEKEADEYGVSFSSHDAKFYRRDGDIETLTEIVISSEENVELRKIEVRNIGEDVVEINLINYVEFILSTLNADIVHPAYNSLFQSVFEIDGNFVLEKRFQNGEKIYATFFAIPLNNMNISFEYETDKINFIGRCNNLKNPIALTEGSLFSNKFAENVNPIMAIKTHVKLISKESIEINYFVGIAHSIDEISEIIGKYKTKENENRLVELAKSRALIENRFYDLKNNKICSYNRLLSEILKGSRSREKYEKQIMKNTLSQSNLWKFGISGDVPIIMVKIKHVNDVYVIRELIDATIYFNLKKIKIDLVILNEEQEKERYVYDGILRYVNAKNVAYLLGIKGGIHIIDYHKIEQDEEYLLYAVSDVLLNAKKGFLKEQL